MLRVRRVRLPIGRPVASSILHIQFHAKTAQCERRTQRYGSHAGVTNAAPPTSTATEFLAHQQALFPTEFSELSEYIRQDGGSHLSDSQGPQEEAAYNTEEIKLELTRKSKGPTDRHLHPSPFRRRLDQILSLFLPSHPRRNRVDLSYTNALHWQLNNQKLDEESTVTFRSSTSLRKLLLDYLQNIAPLLHGAQDEEKLLLALRATFPHDSLRILEDLGYDITDVASWAWIFSENVDLAFARYGALAQKVRESGRGRIPKFVFLQLLRAENLSVFALKGFIRSILADLQICSEAKEYFGWSWVTRVCLVVRLLRHARSTAPECFGDISVIVKHLFSDYYSVHPRPLEGPELLRLTHIYNRFLSLISLAPQKAPYSAYLSQQYAQLALVRQMFAFTPQLLLTREGYRALIAVQLLHPKTGPERTWAEAKSLSWPPWRHIKSGIEQDLEYPGKESRVIKLLQRMKAAGYSHGDWERSAAVLAGWDTDKSPTIQTRAILMRQRRPWLLLRSPRKTEENESGYTPELWAARIRATRTKREAWASFCSYEKSKPASQAHYQPYFAMLDKLLSSTVQPESTLAWKYLAGDIKEPFEVSANPREVIYVETEVPSVDEFYEHMLRAGVKPGGHLLASLLDYAVKVETGFGYIQASRWDEVTKDVLRHAEKYPSFVIRDSLSKIPKPTLAAFISLMCKSGPEDPLTFRDIGRMDFTTDQLIKRNHQDVPALTYASQLLLAAGISDIRVWNAFIEGASMSIGKSPANYKGAATRAAVWRRVRRILSPEEMYLDIHPDLDTFRHLTTILNTMLRDVNMRIPPENLGSLAKMTFIRAIYGRLTKAFLPGPERSLLVVPDLEDLKLVISVLVSIHDTQGLLAVLKWVNEHAAKFGPLNLQSESESQNTVHETAQERILTQSPLHDILCAIRLFLEGSRLRPTSSSGREGDAVRFESPLARDPRIVQLAREYCRELHWPSDDEIGIFLARNVKWVERVRRTAELTARRKGMANKKTQSTQRDEVAVG
ncbi:uncharacterized protein Z520_01611 [Fonsecaea multimorphosa CBS 102226]|uniref:Uncharacterized protein n=1 Tax=Fonsecaea multimorphosa CBS 102226 TaxID=1442371 RepID=A0A0D2L243_9EURO|nr:uncharacterized protein Z520_01611 [Fonsecaea multimorphosa CBS 102226]KIY03144.1 hypothetical protein Z520_01611 [Fonsecaea multimorphosa CBS 102226]OAL30389.1 hypothetical protein AYO22_01587 [Fonsecaea multimorphosa]